MVNRPFKALGLNGKAVLPMVLGLGCDTMATMTTRILETRKERIQMTLLLAPGVPCSTVTLEQRTPAFVLRVGETELTVDESIAQEILTRA